MLINPNVKSYIFVTKAINLSQSLNHDYSDEINIQNTTIINRNIEDTTLVIFYEVISINL